MSVIVKSSNPKHRCGITASGAWWETDASGRSGVLHDTPGAVRACTGFGRTWVAMSPPPGMAVTVWRREGRLERWLRMRREAKL